MGSQTFEILRQGFWASFTGGWFFDPHQDIFCNTVHMYFWLGLLLTPFILHLTAESVIVPTILYPCSIFIIFTITKVINYKLHILFDGEELLEVKNLDNQLNSATELSPTFLKLQENSLNLDPDQDKPTSSKHDDDDPKVAETSLMKPEVSIQDEINDALKKEGIITKDIDNNEEDAQKNSNCTSNNELVIPQTPRILSPEKACIVDLHHTKVNDEENKTNEMENGNDIEEAKSDASVTTPVDTNAEDNNLIIANKPTVKDFDKVSKTDDTPQNFPLNLHRLLDTSSDSSWESSSSISSPESNASVSKVTFYPIDYKTQPQQHLMIDNDLGEVKSENNLVKKPKEIINENTENPKAVSLSALSKEKEEGKQKFEHEGGARRKTNTDASVGLSLPALPTVSEFSEDTLSFDAPSASSSVHPNSMASSELRESATSDDTDNDIKALPDKIENHARPIRRQGAFRESAGGSRVYNRFHPGRSGSSGAALLQSVEESNKDGKHIAMSHEDTSAGAVHCFQDEFGQWYSYAFGDGEAVPLPQTFLTDAIQDLSAAGTQGRRRSQRRDSLSSNISHPDLDTAIRDFTSNRRIWRSQFSPFIRPSLDIKIDEEPAAKKYYMLPVIGSYSVKISFDRLALLALLDRNKNIVQAVIAVLLATLVALLGYMLLSRNYFYDFWLFVLCFVIAKCQFSLLKSVQPDSASPIHGHNNTITFSIAIYFCITALFIIAVDEAAKRNPVSINLYTVPLYSKATFEFAKDLLIAFLLAFPIIFLLGLLPQIDTFTMHVLEQFHIHIFGGSALTSIAASFFSIARCVIFSLILAGLAYIPLKLHDGDSKGQHAMFSVYCGVLVGTCYHLSRATSSPEILIKLLHNYCCCKQKGKKACVNNEEDDPLPAKLLETVKTRFIHDCIVSVLISFVVFAVHLSTAFSTLQPTLTVVIVVITSLFGIIIHYIIPQLRKQLPWLLLASPVLKSYEYMQYEWQEPSKITWFEKLYVWMCIMEKNILYPVLCMCVLTKDADAAVDKFGVIGAAFVMSVCGMKFLRFGFGNTPHQHIILIWTVLLFNFDYHGCSETFLIDFFFMAIFVEKMMELYLKFKFILTYTAPWQILWGSAFHAFAQPVSVPHCGMLFLQTVVSAFFSAPLNPFLGSAIFITSYMRPVKFWEKDYNTKRVDHSNTRLSSHIERNPGADDNNLNSIFYEHLTRSLQRSLCGDLLLGRWGNFSSGDCFIMASDYLNALVHIIEVGNGFVTFQLRGLEFRGTYCQQREVEAITENVDDDMGCCCCQPGHLQNFLSFNSAFSQRWLAWEVTQTKYIVEGYSVSDNTATSMFQMFDLRKIFISYYVTSIIFYCVRNKKVLEWINNANMMSQLDELNKQSYIDLDTIFRPSTDKDYDLLSGGVTRQSFCKNYQEWLVCCNNRRELGEKIEDDGASSDIVTLCFALSLLGRRLLSTASNNSWNAALKSFLHGLHGLFKGDFRVTAAKDEWVFADTDLELLRAVVAPAVRMALKLHQDHFTCVDEFDDNEVLYDAISQHEDQFVICHEGHPEWRQAVLHNKSNLLALRYVVDDGSDDYKIIMLTKRCLNFRVIKVNKECVRGLWAGQLQELIFLRNRNPERGSIQNAKQALRNMINSSCDQPIGYPIYVSPLTTSYCETNPQFSSLSFGSVNGNTIRGFFTRCYRSIANQYTGHCSRQGVIEIEMTTYQPSTANVDGELTRVEQNSLKPTTISRPGKSVAPSKGIQFRASSYTSIPSSSNNSTSSNQSEGLYQNFPYFRSEGRVRLKDISRVLEVLNSRMITELQWPNLTWFRERANMSCWDGWYPHESMIGDIIYQWTPKHEDVNRRSHMNRKILLLKVDEYVVPILEDGVVYLDANNKEIEV